MKLDTSVQTLINIEKKLSVQYYEYFYFLVDSYLYRYTDSVEFQII